VGLALHEGTRGSLLMRRGNPRMATRWGVTPLRGRGRTFASGVLVRRQGVAEADGRCCDLEKRRRTPSQKEGAVCVAGGLASRGQTAARKRRRNRDSETASSLPCRDGKVAATVRAPLAQASGEIRESQRETESAIPHWREGIPGCGYRVIVTDTRCTQSAAVSQGRCESANRIGPVEKRQGCQRCGELARGNQGRKRPPRKKPDRPPKRTGRRETPGPPGQRRESNTLRLRREPTRHGCS